MPHIARHPILPIPENRKAVKFRFNDIELEGLEGEVVSSALMAHGYRQLAIHQRGDTPQGLFCANGQCSHCTLIIDGLPQKSCVTPLHAGMDIKTLRHLPRIPIDHRPLKKFIPRELTCDVLVVGGGPAGLTATLELARLGHSVILADDKAKLGGKLLLQTHKFFGSIEDCYAGSRGIEIAEKLEQEIRTLPNVTVMTNTTVAAIYKDQKAGLFVNNTNYVVVAFKGLIVAPGAREKSLIFPGNHLPGVYGAGAFQTLVNRDLVKAGARIFIVGSGNVGLIAAYHALQAGIAVAGICDILDRVSGYKVHADKIQRMGVPLFLRHTVIAAEGDSEIERITVASVDDAFRPVLKTAKTFAVDTLLIAVGLTPVDEFFAMANQFGFNVIKAGDADEIAEASSAMFGGRIAGLQMAQKLGNQLHIDATYYRKAEILKSKPGQIFPPTAFSLTDKFRPVIRCDEEIPCNPCTSVCPVNAIQLENRLGTIMDIPRYTSGCTGCGLCVLICPGLAITLARRVDANTAEVVLPYEFIPDFQVGDKIELTATAGAFLGYGEVQKIRYHKKFRTYLVTAKTTLEIGMQAAGIRVQSPAISEPLSAAKFDFLPDEGVVCHCELVTVREVVDFIRKHAIRDVNQLKLIRVGMGACGGKNCSVLLPQLFRKAGVPWEEVTLGSKRPLSVEIPMSAIINEADEV